MGVKLGLHQFFFSTSVVRVCCMSSKNNNEIMVPPSKKAFEQTFLSEKYNVPTSLFLNLISAKLIAVKGYHYLMATFSCTFHCRQPTV